MRGLKPEGSGSRENVTSNAPERQVLRSNKLILSQLINALASSCSALLPYLRFLLFTVCYLISAPENISENF